jgi:hypothetical protein
MRHKPFWSLASVLDTEFDRVEEAEARAVAHVRAGGLFDANDPQAVRHDGARDALPVLIAA